MKILSIILFYCLFSSAFESRVFVNENSENDHKNEEHEGNRNTEITQNLITTHEIEKHEKTAKIQVNKQEDVTVKSNNEDDQHSIDRHETTTEIVIQKEEDIAVKASNEENEYFSKKHETTAKIEADKEEDVTVKVSDDHNKYSTEKHETTDKTEVNKEEDITVKASNEEDEYSTQKHETIAKTEIHKEEDMTVKASNEDDKHSSEKNDNTTKVEVNGEDITVKSNDDDTDHTDSTEKYCPKKAIIDNKVVSAKELRFYEDYNKKLQAGYQTYFDNLENEDQVLRAFNGGDQEVSKFEGMMDGVPILRYMLGKTCFRDIGCFSAMEYQDITKRPIPLLPLSPDTINPSFHLFTLESQSIMTNFSYNATSESLQKSNFNPEFRTVFIIHGFRSGYEPWMELIKDFLFNQTMNEYNIFLVVWEKGAKVPMYHLAATNTRVVGALVAFFMNQLAETYKISNDKFYIIGHSLGAHVSGYAGKRLHDPKVSRITGLDPAGPGFHFNEPHMRLHASDAQQVDVIHTDCADVFTDGLGLNQPFGYIDFYPNGGMSQPGCPMSKGIMNLVSAALSGEEISCSHTRAYFFAGTMGKPEEECYPMAYECDNWETFMEGRCAFCGEDELSRCHLMGIYPYYWEKVKSSRKTIGWKYFVNTAENENFCLYHYQIALHVSNRSDLCSGRIAFNLTSTKDDQKLDLYIERLMTKLTPGSIHTILVTSKFSFGKIEKIQIEWKRFARGERFQSGRFMKIPFIEVYYMSHIYKGSRDENSVILCPEGDPEIRTDGKNYEYDVCKEIPPQLARDLPYDKLKPLTVREDLSYVDYESKDRIVHKLVKSNFINVLTKTAKPKVTTTKAKMTKTNSATIVMLKAPAPAGSKFKSKFFSILWGEK